MDTWREETKKALHWDLTLVERREIWGSVLESTCSLCITIWTENHNMRVRMKLALCRNFYKAPFTAQDQGWAVGEEEVKIYQARCSFMHCCSPHIRVKHFSVAITRTSMYHKSGRLRWSGAMAEAWGQNSAESRGYKQTCDYNDSNDPWTRLVQRTANPAAQFSVELCFVFFFLYSCIISTWMQNVICFFFI